MMLAMVACASSSPPPVAADPPPPAAAPPAAPPPVAADPPPPATAADAPPTAEQANKLKSACADPSGTVLVAVDRIKQGSQGTPDQKQTATIFNNGAWSMTDTVGGAAEAGCVSDADRIRLRDELANAPWQIKHAKFRCMMVSLVHTEYSVHGKLVWTEKVCSGETLDKASAAAIADVDAVMQKLEPNRQNI
jgi:hypothetical protein